MSADLINGGFEFAAGIAILGHCFRLLEDRRVAGVSTGSVAFFSLWGVWNIYYYPLLDQFWSFAGGIFVTLANTAYVALLIRFRKATAP
jgi:hypothetical protein